MKSHKEFNETVHIVNSLRNFSQIGTFGFGTVGSKVCCYWSNKKMGSVQNWQRNREQMAELVFQHYQEDETMIFLYILQLLASYV